MGNWGWDWVGTSSLWFSLELDESKPLSLESETVMTSLESEDSESSEENNYRPDEINWDSSDDEYDEEEDYSDE